MYQKFKCHGPKFILGDFNARVHRAQRGEEHIFGGHCFGREVFADDEMSNRNLLFELCCELELQAASLFFEFPPEQLVTYRDLGVQLCDQIICPHFVQLDYVLATKAWRRKILDLRTVREAHLRSQHFLLMGMFDCQVEKREIGRRRAVDLSSLGQHAVAFRNGVFDKLTGMLPHTVSPTKAYESLTRAMVDTSVQALPKQRASPQKPWISSFTLGLIDSRNLASEVGDTMGAKILLNDIKRAAKADRRQWLQTLAGSGDWSQLRLLRKGKSVARGRLRDREGAVVPSDEKAETLAEYFDKVQWRVRPVTADSDAEADIIGEELAVNSEPISMEELLQATKKLKRNKVSGIDEVPAEFWKIILADHAHPASSWILDFLNSLWSQRDIPDDWHLSRVTALFKKGDLGDCGNYRPISLICVGYKLFASILLQRLETAGAEDRIWNIQFGFKGRRGTTDALLLARRILEQTQERPDRKILMLALDGAKAFDSVAPQRLIEALRRFGLPRFFTDIVSSIYSSRNFFVRCEGQDSTWHEQAFGIVQGCPLSPFLFSIVMTCLLQDANAAVEAKFGPIKVSIIMCRSILYVDDTLFIETKGDVAQFFMDEIWNYKVYRSFSKSSVISPCVYLLHRCQNVRRQIEKGRQ